jgi:hypothetical protein
MTDVKLYQIAYSPETLAEIAPGYLILNNMDGARNDWREYWPIRNFLLNNVLSEEGYYGFFSPRFQEKTKLTYAQTVEFIQSSPSHMDVITFSPLPDMGAFFLNVFEQSEVFDPGFTLASEAFLNAIGMPVALGSLVMDSRQTVFSNFFVARPKFWRAWLELNEKLFAICEGPECELRQLLIYETTYPGPVERKVFLMERIVSLMLTINADWKVHTYNTFETEWSITKLGGHKLDAVISDALKIAFREQGFPHYLNTFSSIRNKLR